MIRLGDVGPDVVAWQRFLASRGLSLPLYGPDGHFGAETAQATRSFQISHGLPSTGILDDQTLAAARAVGYDSAPEAPSGRGVASPDWPPKPSNLNAPSVQDQQERFGPLQWRSAGDPARPEQIVFTNAFEAEKIERVVVPQIAGLVGAPKDGGVAWNKLAEVQIKRLFKAWQDAGLLNRVLTWAGSYNPRLIRGSTTKLSNHAFGAAFDINAEWNPLGHVPALVGARGAVRELVPIANRLGFFWGGHYSERPDGMHFEVAKLMSTEEIDAALARGEIGN